MVDSKENYKFDLGVQELISLPFLITLFQDNVLRLLREVYISLGQA